MKILRINSSGYEEGGIENGIVLSLPLHEKHGHTVRVFSSDMRPDLPHFNHYSYRSPRGALQKLFHTFNPYAYVALKKALKEFEPDVVHLQDIGYASPSILFALRKYPTLASMHGPEGYTKSLLVWCLPASDFHHGKHDPNDLKFIGKIRYFYYRWINLPLYRLGLRNVDVFVTLSRYMQSLMASEGIQSVYIPNATTLLEHKPLKRNELTHTLAYAGRLEHFKGVDHLLNALPEVLRAVPDAQLYIAGDGPARPELEALAKRLRIEQHVTFVGRLDRIELEKLYQHASLVVMPSIWPEAFGKMGIEAMSVGRPVVAANVGGITEWLIDGKAGFLVPPKDAHAIAQKVITLFSDDDLLLAFGMRARQRAEDFELEKQVTRLEELYAGLLSGAKNADANESHIVRKKTA